MSAWPAQTRLTLREEPGLYRFEAWYETGGQFFVTVSALSPLALTLRVEDVWQRLPRAVRHTLYTLVVSGDTVTSLANVAPDARIQFDITRETHFAFTPVPSSHV